MFRDGFFQGRNWSEKSIINNLYEREASTRQNQVQCLDRKHSIVIYVSKPCRNNLMAMASGLLTVHPMQLIDAYNVVYLLRQKENLKNK